MSDVEENFEDQLPLEGVGQTLRRAREKNRMSLEQLAAETRIPQRHLELIEAGDFAGLPARTYAIGFSRSYAKAVGLDDRLIADQVRAELAETGSSDRGRTVGFEPGDPARIPTRGLAWLSALAAILLLVGGFAYFRDYFMPGAGPGPLQEAPAVTPAAQAAGTALAEPINPAGPVVFTALEDGVWVRFYDAAGTRLMEKEMSKGESYTVPADVEGPRLWTGRPDALEITIGGEPVPKLAEEDQIMRDVAIGAQALLARQAPAAASGTVSSAPAGGAAPENAAPAGAVTPGAAAN